jgi:hypothetical protein
MKIAFDIDDTLIVPSVALTDNGGRDTPNYDTIAIYKWFQAQGNEMILWSGSGMDWAQTWGEKLGLAPFTVMPKEKHVNSVFESIIDIAFDDCEVDLATVNVRVKRLNNSISRADWNKNKHE